MENSFSIIFAGFLVLAVFGAGTKIVAAPDSVTLFHVAPDGKDEWSGKLVRSNSERSDGPWASLVGARDGVRRLHREKALSSGKIEVHFADGEYAITEAMAFLPEDSGTADSPILFRSAGNAHPVFHGGKRIAGFRKGDDGLWKTTVPGVAEGSWKFE